jgi:hypothetical protein
MHGIPSRSDAGSYLDYFKRKVLSLRYGLRGGYEIVSD